MASSSGTFSTWPFLCQKSSEGASGKARAPWIGQRPHHTPSAGGARPAGGSQPESLDLVLTSIHSSSSLCLAFGHCLHGPRQRMGPETGQEEGSGPRLVDAGAACPLGGPPGSSTLGRFGCFDFDDGGAVATKHQGT